MQTQKAAPLELFTEFVSHESAESSVQVSKAEAATDGGGSTGNRTFTRKVLRDVVFDPSSRSYDGFVYVCADPQHRADAHDGACLVKHTSVSG